MLFSPLFFTEALGVIYRLQEKITSHHSRRINRLINDQGSAADPRPGPRFRGNVLAVASTISLTFCYAACAQLELLEVGDYTLNRSRIGLHGCGLLKTPLIP